ncbi:hypothetical protein DBR23_13025 [Acidovorax sp. HMWF018]|uniref:SOS response-associated peptidase family protein n=1 Tax=Acidovorax sp. HMWF018 TaxID=2056855 RepID=UPI000D3C124F|nr:SOS response-associated peptidase family protein [Acidovorax sp. HMWF018]PTT38810.1 hypothetical protein DBR23_13025 [Acidovorax sp. HMWF018]
MCYSAAVRADHAAFQRLFPSSRMAIKEFFELYWRKKAAKPVPRTPRVMDAQFTHAKGQDEQAVRELIAEFDAAQVVSLEQDLFKQRKRLADAERTLQTKVTKKAQEDQRISTAKIEQALQRLSRMKRPELNESDARIFPGWWAPVLVMEDGEPVIRPMRYQCRPAGKPAFYDTKYPGTYNARRDNLRGFWRGQFGQTHGLMIVTTFFENVARHAAEGRELLPGESPENTVLRFEPRPAQDMYVACLYSHWTSPNPDEPDLWSFAAVTDDPPPEVAAAGHDRCIVQLRPENVARWLTPAGRSLDELDALLDDKEPAFYEHRLAA